MTNEKKIVQPGEVNFEGDSTKADENTKPNQNQNTTQNSQYSNSDRDIENMKFLTKNLGFPWGVYEVYGTATGFANQGKVEFGSIKNLIPYVVSLVGRGQRGLQISTSIESELIIPFLEENYGSDLDQTGIYEAIGLKGGIGLPNINNLIIYFPEFREIKNLNQQYILRKNNPFLTILTLPLEARSFFSGILKENQTLYDSDTFKTNLEQTLSKPITTKHAMEYARQTNELPKIKDFMKWYSQV